MLRLFAYVGWGIFVFGLVTIILMLTVNLDFIKPQIEAQATALLQQKVRINGDIKPGVLDWRPAVIMHNVTVGADLKAKKVALTLQSLQPGQRFLVHADGLEFRNYPLGNYDIPLISLPTGFEMHSLKGELEGSVLAGEVTYTGNKLHMDGVMKNFPLSKLADGAEGKVDGKILLEAKGKDSAQLKRTLSGRLMLTGGAGKLTNKSLNFWSRGLLASLLLGNKTETKLNCAILDFDIRDGAALSRAIVVDTDEIYVLGKGRIDLDSGQIDMILKPHPKSLELVSFATPVHVTGQMDNPFVTPEADGVAKKIGGMLLGVINPALVLVPMLTAGMDNYSGACVKILQQQSDPL